MAGDRDHGKSSCKNNSVIHVNMQTIPKPTTVSPQQGGTPTNIETSTQKVLAQPSPRHLQLV